MQEFLKENRAKSKLFLNLYINMTQNLCILEDRVNDIIIFFHIDVMSQISTLKGDANV